MPHRPVTCCSVDCLVLERAGQRSGCPNASSATMTKTTELWPRLNQKPTLIGRWPSAISLRVVLSMAAMWSASNACRMPSV